MKKKKTQKTNKVAPGSSFDFIFEISPDILEYYWEYSKRSTLFCDSPIFYDKKSKTEWYCQWFPYGDDNSINDIQSQLYVGCLNKPFNIDSFTCYRKAICLQNNQCVEFNGSEFDTKDIPVAKNFSLTKGEMTFNCNDLKKYKKLNFHVFITFNTINYS